jgi:hypothetical protein
VLLSETVDVAIEGRPHRVLERVCEASVREDDRLPGELVEEWSWLQTETLDVGDERLPPLRSG